jgi:hypothetical protein
MPSHTVSGNGEPGEVLREREVAFYAVYGMGALGVFDIPDLLGSVFREFFLFFCG